jgi:hypothetical protein
MREEIAAQHRRLDPLFEAVRSAFERAAAQADRALAELEEALATHFDQEDRLYYPTIGSLRPEHRGRVERFAADHQRFLAHLEAIGEHVRGRGLADAARDFEVFAGDFARHEAQEEALLHDLQVELDAAR